MTYVRWHTSSGYSTVLSSAIQVAPFPAAADEPISLAEAKAHLNLPATPTIHDGNIPRWIQAARSMVERATGIALVPQTWELYLETWGTTYPGAIELPRWPLQSLDAIEILDDAGLVATTVSPATYWTDLVRRPPRIVFTATTSLTGARTYSPIRIRYTAGFEPEEIPPELLSAIYLWLGDFALHKGDEREPAAQRSGPMGVEGLIASWVRPGVA